MLPELPTCSRCGTNEFVEPDKPRPGERRVPAFCCECGALVGHVELHGPPSEQERRRKQADQLLRGAVLTPWERKFIESIAPLRTLSGAQLDKWETIKAKRL